jgi:hypothetical protein
MTRRAGRGAAGAVREFGGERGVAAKIPLAQQRRQGEVGAGVPPETARNIERRPAGRVERFSSRRAFGLVIGLVRIRRAAPRAQSVAFISFCPAAGFV